MAVVTDTIADMLTRIRNANSMRYTEVKVPAYTLSDNGRVEMITVTVYYRGADGIMYPVENGKITVTEAGTYSICFYLVDENQNYTIECYDFVAVNK